MRTGTLPCALQCWHLKNTCEWIFINEFVNYGFWFLDIVSLGKWECKKSQGKKLSKCYISLLLVSRFWGSLFYSLPNLQRAQFWKYRTQALGKGTQGPLHHSQCHGPLWPPSWISPCCLTCCGRVFTGLLVGRLGRFTSEPIVEGHVQ